MAGPDAVAPETSGIYPCHRRCQLPKRPTLQAGVQTIPEQAVLTGRQCPLAELAFLPEGEALRRRLPASHSNCLSRVR